MTGFRLVYDDGEARFICYIAELSGTIPRLLLRLCRFKLLTSKESQENENLESTKLVCYIIFFHLIVVIPQYSHHALEIDCHDHKII